MTCFKKPVLQRKDKTMSIRKLLKKAKSFLSAEDRKRKEKKKFLSRVIKKLKKHEKNLIENLKTEQDKKTLSKIKEEIALTHAQRKKGLKMLKKI